MDANNLICSVEHPGLPENVINDKSNTERIFNAFNVSTF